ncbi:MAG: hypothetical protein QM619_00860 [Micropruina sp.]|uniref:hypothetical protein n=1 Tax=Micropruina sp. TaxID=2737536 RepID=UPI0039E6268F
MVVAVRDYPDAAPDFANGMDAQVAELREWWAHEELGDDRFTVIEPFISTRDDVHQLIASERLAHAGPGDVLVLCLTGHGLRTVSGRHYLCMPDGDDDYPHRGHIRTADIVEQVLASDAEHIVVLISSCFGNSTTDELHWVIKDLKPARRSLDTISVITIGDFDQSPRVLELRELLSAARQRLTARKTGNLAPHLTVDQFTSALNAAATDLDADRLRPHKIHPQTPTEEPCLALPNPAYRPPRRVVRPQIAEVAASPADLHYWLDRASGRTDGDDAGWYFSGRRELATTIADFLRHDTGNLVVTGMAGSGKSALLARAVTLSDPAFLSNPGYSAAVDAIRQHTPETIPPDGSVRVALLARNQSSLDLLRSVAQGLGVTSTPADWTAAQLRESIVTKVGNATATVVLDGLDEASDPFRVVADLLIPLATHTNAEGGHPLRFAIGVRSPGPEGQPGSLLALLRDALPQTDILRSDDESTADIAEYVEAVLSRSGGQSAGARYRADPELRATAAGIIARSVSPSFLDARLAAHRLLNSEQPPDLTDPDWLRSLAEGTVGLLRDDLRDFGGLHPDHTLAVLRATAFSFGRGLPWADIWPAVAEAVADEQIPNTDAVIESALTGRLSGYLTEDNEDDRRVYRPVHERLAETLRANHHQLLGDTAEVAEEPTAVHARIAERLSGLLPSSSDKEYPAPEPYLRRHLIEHAAQGQCLEDQIVPPEFLPWETSGLVRGRLGLPLPDEPDVAGLTAWSTVEPYLADAPIADRTLSLAFARAARQLPGPSPTGSLQPRWAHWPSNPNVLCHASVSCLTSVERPHGPHLLATGGNDHRIRLWDPSTGEQVGQTLIGHTLAVTSITSFVDCGQVRLATASYDRTVRIWDPDTGQQIGQPLTGHAKSVIGLTTFIYHGRPRLATVGYDGIVHIWYLDTCRWARSLLTDPAQVVNGITSFTHHGQLRLATTSNDRTVRIWDPATGRRVRSLRTDHDHSYGLSGITSFTQDGQLRLATTSYDKTVRIWDIDTGERVGKPLTGHTHPQIRVTTLAHHGRLRLATASNDGTVRVWDIDTGEQVGKPLTGHTGEMSGITSFTIRDRNLLATTNNDRTLRIWDPHATEAQVEHPLAGHTGAVTRITGFTQRSRTLLATTSWDETVRIWDPDTGQQIGHPLTDHTSRVTGIPSFTNEAILVTGITSFTHHGGRTLLATASNDKDKTVRVWDSDTGQQIGQFLTRHTNPVSGIVSFARQDGQTLLATTGRDETVQIWDPDTGQQIGQFLTRHTNSMSGIVSFARQDGRILLATASDDKTARVWDPDTNEQVGDALTGHTGAVTRITGFNHNNHPRLATTGMDVTVRIWDPETGRPVGRPLAGHSSSITGIASFTHDNRTLLATTSSDETVRIWDPGTGTEIQCLFTATPATSIWADDAGRYLIIGGPDGRMARLDIVDSA